MLFFLRAAARAHAAARWRPSRVSGALALLTHYFAVFLLVPMVRVAAAARRAGAGAALAARARARSSLVGLALLPLISAQGGHGTQWIGRWALVERLEAIPQYYLTGYSGAPLGHGVELLVALPILAGVRLRAVARRSTAARGARRARDRLVVAAGGRDPRCRRARRFRRRLPRAAQPHRRDDPAQRAARGPRRRAAHRQGARVWLGAVSRSPSWRSRSTSTSSPRLQRGDWRGARAQPSVAQRRPSARVITTVELGRGAAGVLPARAAQPRAGHFGHASARSTRPATRRCAATPRRRRRPASAARAPRDQRPDRLPLRSPAPRAGREARCAAT